MAYHEYVGDLAGRVLVGVTGTGNRVGSVNALRWRGRHTGGEGEGGSSATGDEGALSMSFKDSFLGALKRRRSIISHSWVSREWKSARKDSE